MTTKDTIEEAIEGLQELGLQEYEARCFVGLSRLSTGTAKKLSEITEVPRTRVYDAIRVLESKGLVEIHHSSPQQFRAVPLNEARETLRDQFESRVDRVHRALENIETLDSGGDSPVQEVWSMSGATAIENRTAELITDASDEIVLIIGDESALTGGLVAALNDVPARTDLVLGGVTQQLTDKLGAAVDGETAVASDIDWMQQPPDQEGRIGHALLVDGSTLLVSSILPDTGERYAIYARGYGNSFVLVVRQLVSGSLLAREELGELPD